MRYARPYFEAVQSMQQESFERAVRRLMTNDQIL
jgi:hypothetical protein